VLLSILLLKKLKRGKMLSKVRMVDYVQISEFLFRGFVICWDGMVLH
jgi:hypothetical protein